MKKILIGMMLALSMTVASAAGPAIAPTFYPSSPLVENNANATGGRSAASVNNEYHAAASSANSPGLTSNGCIGSKSRSFQFFGFGYSSGETKMHQGCRDDNDTVTTATVLGEVEVAREMMMIKSQLYNRAQRRVLAAKTGVYVDTTPDNSPTSVNGYHTYAKLMDARDE